ncbi:hypothetical protein RchiOBHm_Chr2g0135461 [Rosa chinensis]|uniref:Uncharacterized protein n=1 Tax=Rosa chinensis TaxID=74649 RepID=A0A2P6RW42_ROSCH|nr:hypothetical protein RchiOBHm_Chr2g0135461 [Rosa chinensis]
MTIMRYSKVPLFCFFGPDSLGFLTSQYFSFLIICIYYCILFIGEGCWFYVIGLQYYVE